MPARKSVKKRTSRTAIGRKKTVTRQKATKALPVRKTAVRKKSAAKSPPRKKVAKKRTPEVLGRPRVAGTAELDEIFRKDREAREVCEFLGVRTLKELEQLTPDEIVERLTGPVVRTVGRIRKALALNNRCLAGDQKFAVAFKKELS